MVEADKEGDEEGQPVRWRRIGKKKKSIWSGNVNK
jgi:hypothetical protein